MGRGRIGDVIGEEGKAQSVGASPVGKATGRVLDDFSRTLSVQATHNCADGDHRVSREDSLRRIAVPASVPMGSMMWSQSVSICATRWRQRCLSPA